MESTRQARYQARARIIKALAHPARLLMVDELRGKPRCVCELQAEVNLDMSTVSKHLSVLKHAGIVQDEKRGVQVYYRLRCPCVVNFFECAEKVLATTARDQARLLTDSARGGKRKRT
jgi:ArsR family transcriptional regulator